MKFQWVVVCGALLVSWSGAARAQTRTQCLRGDCEYHFDDEGLNSPGYSAYGEWLRVRPGAKRVLLIRPRISFVMELVKSTLGI